MEQVCRRLALRGGLRTTGVHIAILGWSAKQGREEAGSKPRTGSGETDVYPVAGIADDREADCRYQTPLQVAAGTRRRDDTPALKRTYTASVAAVEG